MEEYFVAATYIAVTQLNLSCKIVPENKELNLSCKIVPENKEYYGVPPASTVVAAPLRRAFASCDYVLRWKLSCE
jgi:hypothetical protein